MAEPNKRAPRKAPKGGRKGGTIFPKLNLQKALEYGKRLVAKTHVASQPEDEILPGVFGNSGPPGKVRASALKQFGLMQGDAKAYQASPLAKSIEAALTEERPALLQRSVLSSKVFDKIFDTFHGDTVSKSQIAKRAKELGVHPESADECAQIFIDSAVTAGLGTLSGENISLMNARSMATINSDSLAEEGAEQLEENAAETETQEAEATEVDYNQQGGRPNGAVTVNLAVDSSSDPDKLEKQLKLLKQYGLLR